METFSTLLAICTGNSPASGEFPTQRPVTLSFDVFFDLRLNKRLRKQSRGGLFETLSCPLWRHRYGLQALLDDVKQEIIVLPRVEDQRKQRKNKHTARESFNRNPYAFAKKLFTVTKSDRLDIPQENPEAHLTTTYADPPMEVPLRPIDGAGPLEEPEISFRRVAFQLFEARECIHWVRACSGPGLNGVSFNLYNNWPIVLEDLVCLLQRAWLEEYVPQEWCLAGGVWIHKEEKSVGVGSFRPISLFNFQGKIFFGVVAGRMASFLLQNKYINTSVPRAGIPGLAGSVQHAQMIWNWRSPTTVERIHGWCNHTRSV